MPNDSGITEFDIFQYVFYPKNLSEEKRQKIEVEEFSKEVAFYKELKDELNRELSFEIKRKLAEKIPAYKLTAFVELLPPEKLKKENFTEITSVDSGEYDKSKTTIFTDQNNEYLIRVVKNNNTIDLFIFSIKVGEIKEFSLILYPEGERYYLENNLKPLQITGDKLIDKIVLDFGFPE